MGFFDRLSAGWTAGKSCLEVLRNDRKLIVFPLLSGLSAIIVLASFALPLAIIRPAFLKVMMDDHRVNIQQTPIWFWIVLFLFYFANYFVIYFFNAALVHCALFHFRKQPVTASDGLAAAWRRLPQLLAWAFVSATVGLVLKLIENANEKVGAFVSAILGGAWTVVTYFVVPVLVVERVGPMQAVKRSWQILCKTWGESIGAHAGVGWALLPFWLLGVLLIVLAVFAMAASPVLGVLLIALGIVYFLGLGLVDATLKGIMMGALYLYSTQGEVPEEFERESLNQSFVPKKA
jgi:uncharacterized membrane protein